MANNLASITYLNNCLAGGLAIGTTYYISLHSATPGITGASEFTGGGYSRQTWVAGTPASALQGNTNSIAIPNAGSTAATHFGIWSAATSGTFYIGVLIGGGTPITAASITFAANTAQVGASAP